VAAERTNPQQSRPKSPECDRNLRSVPGRFTLLGEGSSRADILMEVCCAALLSRPFAAAPYFDWEQKARRELVRTTHVGPDQNRSINIP
jgi:hypothetical protein